MRASWWIGQCLLFPYVWANTEKTIFLGPPPVDIDSTYPALDHLQVLSLNPRHFAVRTHLEVESPNNESRHGKVSWFVLHNLTEDQRYEVRVCWAATQPTAFRLETYELETVFKEPELTAELSAYAYTLQSNENSHVAIPWQTLEPGMQGSVLLLRIVAAADFYTTNHTLMRNAPPILVDIILDPFILNILPRSLLPTVIYIIAVAPVSWFVGRWISSWVRQLATEPTKQKFQ
ncbi:hypothetical protein F4860DRAFT_169196 [Xylaria cubensis]|nr:hypothetical protein F4860DRAFT_169196 [Xylaria cubensis]